MSNSANQQDQSCVVRSPAKVNLFLEVLGLRSDGFHELETVMVRTDLYDILWIRDQPGREIELTLAEPTGAVRRFTQAQSNAARDFPLGEANLIIRAARALQEVTGVERGATIRVHKRIPTRAGLGGGSSNAATALLALNDVWALKLPMPFLHEIAATLGSDVNFLLSGYRAAVCGGRGEEIRPVDVNGQFHGVLLLPSTGNSTSEIFSALQLPDEQRSAVALIQQLRTGQASMIHTHCFNRLQSAAEQLNPDVLDAMSWLDKRASGGMLTGSGSACFCLLNTAREARRLADQYTSLKNGLATAFRF